MVTIIAGSNRSDGYTIKVAEKYCDLMTERGMENLLFSLDNIPSIPLDDAIYKKGSHALRDFGHSLFGNSNRLVLVVPEYNGSIPGVLKLLIDACDPALFKGKRFALVGVSSGRAGNLRGMDHLTDIFHYLQAEVYSLKQPVSQVHKLVNAEKELVDEPTIATLVRHIEGFTTF